jgi:hypothetical protein
MQDVHALTGLTTKALKEKVSDIGFVVFAGGLEEIG